jgi:hypothetical protein
MKHDCLTANCSVQPTPRRRRITRLQFQHSTPPPNSYPLLQLPAERLGPLLVRLHRAPCLALVPALYTAPKTPTRSYSSQLSALGRCWFGCTARLALLLFQHSTPPQKLLQLPAERLGPLLVRLHRAPCLALVPALYTAPKTPTRSYSSQLSALGRCWFGCTARLALLLFQHSTPPQKLLPAPTAPS